MPPRSHLYPHHSSPLTPTPLIPSLPLALACASPPLAHLPPPPLNLPPHTRLVAPPACPPPSHPNTGPAASGPSAGSAGDRPRRAHQLPRLCMEGHYGPQGLGRASERGQAGVARVHGACSVLSSCPITPPTHPQSWAPHPHFLTHRDCSCAPPPHPSPTPRTRAHSVASSHPVSLPPTSPQLLSPPSCLPVPLPSPAPHRSE